LPNLPEFRLHVGKNNWAAGVDSFSFSRRNCENEKESAAAALGWVRFSRGRMTRFKKNAWAESEPRPRDFSRETISNFYLFGTVAVGLQLPPVPLTLLLV
jgi:hypothetical protein